MTETITELAKRITDITDSKGFWKEGVTLDECVGEKIALMHSELSEALEAARNKRPPSKKIPEENLVEELADCVIRVLDFCARFDLPIESAINNKVAFNQTREHKHGKGF